MSSPTRGRALIINNRAFENRADVVRHGSKVDMDNLKYMMEDLSFEQNSVADCSAEVSRMELIFS